MSQSNHSKREEKLYDEYSRRFAQYSYVDRVASLLIRWIERSKAQIVFEQVEPALTCDAGPVTPDLIASAPRENHGVIFETKAERAKSNLENEFDKVRSSLENYLTATKRWPAQPRGATRDVKCVDVLLVSHYSNALDYLGCVEGSKVLVDALKENLALLAWEVVETRYGPRLRVRYHKGSCRLDNLLTDFRSINGYEEDLADLIVFQSSHGVRLRCNEPEILLVLLTQKALALGEPEAVLPSTLVSSQPEIYVRNERIYFTAKALQAYVNGVNESERRYCAWLDLSRVKDMLSILIQIGVIVPPQQDYYSIGVAMKNHVLDEYVLRQYAKENAQKQDTMPSRPLERLPTPPNKDKS